MTLISGLRAQGEKWLRGSSTGAGSAIAPPSAPTPPGRAALARLPAAGAGLGPARGIRLPQEFSGGAKPSFHG